MIWVSASGSIFKILPSKSGSDKIIKEDLSLYIPRLNFGRRNYHIVKITEDTTRNFICFKGENFFTVIDLKTGTFFQWDDAPFNSNMSRNQVVCDKGILWERTTDGLFCFDLLNKKMHRVRSYNTEYDRFMLIPFSIYKDRAGIIWIGTGGYGLLKYNPHTEAFHKISTNSITWMNATPSKNVLLISRELKKFIKNSSGGYSSYVENITFSQEVEHFLKMPVDMAVQDKEGIYWLNSGGLIKLDVKKRSVRFFEKSGDILFPFFLDRQDRLWYATSKSFCLFDKTTSRITSYQFPVSGSLASFYKFCEVIYQDGKGVFWLGTTEGLFSFNESTKHWRQYKNIPGDNSSISNNVIFSICDDPEDPGEYMWVGTNGGGLNRLCISKGSFEHIGTTEGLPNMVVYGILADEDKQIWMSTNNGIACLKPQYTYNTAGKPEKISEKKFRYYYEEDGLQSNEFNRYAYCKAVDGMLFFGGVKGFNYFNPREVTGNRVIPNVVITDFKIGNKPVSFITENKYLQRGERQVLTKPVFLTDKIKLPYSANMVSFDFASLDFASPEKNLYEYKLEGFDKEWIQSGSMHSATYTNLDPGKYIFTVKGSNSDGIWNKRGTSIQLTILTPWYKSWWYRATLVGVITSLVVFFFRYRLQQKLKLYKIRNNLASDLHDEIGSTLSGVYIYSEVAQKTTPDNNFQTKNYLKQISADAGNMIDALNDIVWTVVEKNDRFQNIINRMRSVAVEIFEAKGYQLHLEFDEQLNLLKLGMEVRKNFYLIYKEAVNNAAKYADGKNVWIKLVYTKPFISLSVKDDGKGFAFGNNRSGKGLANMQRRASELKGKFEIISSEGNGTLIQLVFPI